MKTLTLKRGDKKGAETAVMFRKRRHVILPPKVENGPASAEITTTKNVSVHQPGQPREVYPIDDALDLLHRLWPALFAVRIEACRPMKVGIFDDLWLDAESRQLGLSKKTIKRLLRSVVYQVEYRMLITRGAVRYDFTGQTAGFVSEEEETYTRRLPEKTGKLKLMVA